MKKLLAAFLTLFTASSSQSETLEKGAQLPDLEVQTQAAETINLRKAAAEGWVLVYFYPKADTPGCTKQACSLRDAYAELTDLNVDVYGVSRDTVEAQKAFAEKYKLPFTLVADKEGELIRAFGVPTYSKAGPSKRQAFLFKDGILVWRDLSASTEQQAADVLAVVTAK